MIHLAMLLFAYAGFVGICASMAKHQPELLGAKLEPLRQAYEKLGAPFRVLDKLADWKPVG